MDRHLNLIQMEISHAAAVLHVLWLDYICVLVLAGGAAETSSTSVGNTAESSSGLPKPKVHLCFLPVDVACFRWSILLELVPGHGSAHACLMLSYCHAVILLYSSIILL